MQQRVPQQAEQNKVSGFLARYTYLIIAFALLSGMAIGYFAVNTTKASEKAKPKIAPAVNVLIHNGSETRTWNNISLLEGDSAAIILDRIAKIENLPISWSDDSKDRSLVGLQGKDTQTGTWKFYMNNTTPLMSIGRYYPGDGDTISLIYTQNNAQ